MNSLLLDGEFCQAHYTPCPTGIVGIFVLLPERPVASPSVDVKMVKAVAFVRSLRKNKPQPLAWSLYKINKTLDNKTTLGEWKKKFPKEYHEFLDLFSKKWIRMLPPHRPYDDKIDLMEGSESLFKALYGMSRDELQALEDYIEDTLSKRCIWASSSSAGVHVLFEKRNGKLRLCVNYRALNEMMVRNPYPLSLIRETLSRIAKAK